MRGMLIGGGIIAVLALVVISSYVTAYNYGNTAENTLVAEWENNENILAQYGQKIAEAVQVPAMQAEDLAKVFSGANQSRYGADGSDATMQWIREQNPTLDQDTYKQIQRMIEAGRNEFKTSQTRLVDVKRQYNTALGSFWRGTFMGWAGYPNLNTGFRNGTDDYKIITTDRASNAFETGKEKPMTLR